MRPTRQQLMMSRSEFKTLLKRRGYEVPRDLYKYGCVVRRGDRMYRFRYWGKEGFVVDISCPVSEFDRWANSCEKTIPFLEWQNE